MESVTIILKPKACLVKVVRPRQKPVNIIKLMLTLIWLEYFTIVDISFIRKLVSQLPDSLSPPGGKAP